MSKTIVLAVDRVITFANPDFPAELVLRSEHCPRVGETVNLNLGELALSLNVKAVRYEVNAKSGLLQGIVVRVG